MNEEIIVLAEREVVSLFSISFFYYVSVVYGPAEAFTPEHLAAHGYHGNAGRGCNTATVVPDADVIEVAKAIVKVVDVLFGTRPFRVHIDPADDGSEVVNAAADRIRKEFSRRWDCPICWSFEDQITLASRN